MAPTLPLPPRELAAYVLGGAEPEDWAGHFDTMGRRLKEDLLRVLPDALAPGGRVLDFGCGSGRLMRHLLEEAAVAEIHGCDIDVASVTWVQEQLCPPCHAFLVPPQPPLPFADASLDVVLAVSVFSQLADGWEAWLLELRRILRPGGRLVVTTMGPRSAPVIAGMPLTEKEIGMSIHGFGRPWAAGGPMILHSEWWLRAHYGRAFDVLGFVPSGVTGQDALVLERPAADRPAPTPAQLAAPEAGEPRELSAAVHDVARLHRDHATLNAAHDAYAAAYAEESRRSAELRAQLDARDAAGRRWRR